MGINQKEAIAALHRERMLTASGRAAAEERSAFMHEFFRRLCEESGVE